MMGLRRDRNDTISGPQSARQRNAIEMAFCWLADNDPPLNAGLVHVALWFLGDLGQYCLETLYFCDLHGGGGGPDPL